MFISAQAHQLFLLFEFVKQHHNKVHISEVRTYLQADICVVS